MGQTGISHQPVLPRSPGLPYFQPGQWEPPKIQIICKVVFLKKWPFHFTLKSFLCCWISSILVCARSKESGSVMLKIYFDLFGIFTNTWKINELWLVMLKTVFFTSLVVNPRTLFQNQICLICTSKQGFICLASVNSKNYLVILSSIFDILTF